jgi:hypothetical protein
VLDAEFLFPRALRRELVQSPRTVTDDQGTEGETFACSSSHGALGRTGDRQLVDRGRAAARPMAPSLVTLREDRTAVGNAFARRAPAAISSAAFVTLVPGLSLGSVRITS